MIDEWPPLDTVWSQETLHAYARAMGINPEPTEIIPQGVKFIEWPQTPLTEKELAHCREIARQLESGERKPLNIVIPRKRDPRRN